MKEYVLIALVVIALVSSPVQALDFAIPNLKIDLIKYEPFPAQSGGYVDTFIKVENTGLAEAGNLECELEPAYPFSLDPGESSVKSIGILPSFEYALLEYKVRIDSNAVDGYNELVIRCSADGLDQGTSLLESMTLNVESSNPEFFIGTVKSSPSDIKAGHEDIKLTVEIQNVGKGDAKLVTANLKLPQGFVPSSSYSNTYNLGNVEKDSSEEAVFYMDVDEDVTEGVYETILLIRYKNENSQEYAERELIVDLNVKPSPSFMVEEVRAGTSTSSDSFSGYIVKEGDVISPSTISQGESGELRIKLSNYGEEEAKSVSVKIFKDSTHPFDFEEIYDFIGNLNPGESSDAVFKFSVDGNAILKKYLVDVEIRYLDGNEVETERTTIPLEVSRQSSGNSLLFIPVAVVILAVGLFLWKRKGK